MYTMSYEIDLTLRKSTDRDQQCASHHNAELIDRMDDSDSQGRENTSTSHEIRGGRSRKGPKKPGLRVFV